MYAFIAELVEGEQVPPKKRQAKLPWNLQGLGGNRNITDAHTVADRAAAGVFEYKRLVAPPGGDVRYRDVVIQGGRPVEVGTILTAAELAQEQAAQAVQAAEDFAASPTGQAHAAMVAQALAMGVQAGSKDEEAEAYIDDLVGSSRLPELKAGVRLLFRRLKRLEAACIAAGMNVDGQSVGPTAAP